jgi:hypothetical protein
MTYKAKKRDYVSWKKDDKVRYGQVVSVADKTITVLASDPAEGEKGGITQAQASFKDIGYSTMARMSMRAMANVRELAENVVVFSMYSSFWKKNSAAGAENMSFLLAELVHEFLTKGFSERFMSFLEPTYLDTEADSWIKGSDFSDSARKLPFVFGFQQIFQKMLFRKPWSHQAMSNLLGGYSALTLTNIADRMAVADKEKSPQYKYP